MKIVGQFGDFFVAKWIIVYRRSCGSKRREAYVVKLFACLSDSFCTHLELV